MSKYFITSVVFGFIVLVEFAEGQNGGKRCGFDEAEFHRVRRYSIYGLPHYKLDLTYKISDYSKNLSRHDVDSTLKRAFNVWTEHVDFTFTQLDTDSTEKPDIDIRFAVRDHGDGYAFDGPGKELAHSIRNWIHFDDEENWKLNIGDEGIYFYATAVHEIGHALGLGHSEVVESIMYPWYGDVDITKLHDDDVLGLLKVYKKKKNQSKFNLDLCRDPQFDTIFKSVDGKILIFKGDVYYELNHRSIVAGPNKITDIWKELPADIDAAFSYDGQTYFFKHGMYWRYEGTKLDRNSPQRINAYGRKLPIYVDSVMVANDNKVYFFKGSNYYRVDKFQEASMIVEEGKIADRFEGIPNDISAAFYHSTHRRTYFFKNESFYIYGIESIKIRPIPFTSYFLDC